MPVYALKVDDGWTWLVKESLCSGEGRFGWSYVETADLHALRHRISVDGWNSLDSEERDCYQESLLFLDRGDYVVYVNVPEWGQCTLAEVTGKYYWRWADNDLNHRFPVDRESVRSFDRNDAMVPPALRARLKLRGRCCRVHAEEEFRRLAEALRRGVRPAPLTRAHNPYNLTDETQPFLPIVSDKIRHLGPRSDLETLVEQVFRRVPGVRSVTRRAAVRGRGADLVVELEVGSIAQLVQTLVVQVRPDAGALGQLFAADDIRQALGAYGADMALIVCPAEDRDPAVESELDRLREDTMKPVALLLGDELAAFLVRHDSALLLE